MSTLFLRNPRLTLLTVGLIVVSGLSSYVLLPRMEDPLLTDRAAFVLTTFPGADAEQVESLVTEPIEDELRDIAEIKELRSSSRNSMSTITIELQDDVYADTAPTVWSRIRDRVADAEAALPVGASKPRFERIEVTAYTRLIALMWDEKYRAADEHEHDLAPDAILRRRAEDLRDLLLEVPGTKDVDIFGDPDEEIVVETDSARLASLGLTAADVSRLVSASDARTSAGLLRGSASELLIEVSGELDSVARIAAIPVQVSNAESSEAQVISLGDIADIRRAVAQPPSELAMVQDQPAIVLGCLIRPTQRVDWWQKASVEVTDKFAAGLSRGIRLVDVFSQDGYVTVRLTELRNNLLLGAVSVMVVIFLLMGWRSAIVVGAALPLAAFMVFSTMRLLEIPVHQMSITGLIIALGLLIDNAIVVVDEVSHKLQAGASRMEAVGRTVSHLAVPLFGSTFTTALAFAPIALMPGPAGEFVGSIAINVIVAIFSSLLLAMTVVPALTGFLGGLSAASGSSESRLSVSGPLPGADASPDESSAPWYQVGWRNTRLLTWYRAFLVTVLDRPLLGVLTGLLLPLAGFVQARLLPEQFFPPTDRDQVAIELELPAQASISETVDVTRRVRQHLLAGDGVDAVTWWIGRSAPPFYYNQIASRRGQPQYAQALVDLTSSADLRQRINDMQISLDREFAGARVIVRQLEQGPPFEAPIEVQIFGPDIGELRRLSDEVRAVLSTQPEVTHLRASMAEPQSRLSVRVDEERARLAGMTNVDVARQMFNTLEGSVGGMVLEGTEELPVRIRVAGDDRQTVDQIETMNLLPAGAQPTADYAGIPLTALGSMELQPEQPDIVRQDRRRLSEVQAFLKAGVLSAPVQAEFQRRFAAAGITLPPGYTLEFGGESAQRNSAVGNLLASVGVLAVMMVAALVLSFKSFRLAALIGVVALLAVGLGLGSLWLFGFPFGFMAIIGTMGLVGVAINDSIVVLAAILEDDAAKNGDTEAVREVVIRATRHVVATSLTTIAGFMPLILAGGSFWPPMAITIAGGVGGATILALIFAPACYLLLMKRSFECPVAPVAAAPQPAVV